MFASMFRLVRFAVPLTSLAAMSLGCLGFAVQASGSVGTSPAASGGCPTSIPSWSQENHAWRYDGRGPDTGPFEWFTAPTVQPSVAGNPLSGKPWFVDCTWDEAWNGSRRVNDWNPLAQQHIGRVYAEHGGAFLGPIQSPERSAVLARFIARQPIAKWIGPAHTGMYNTTYKYLKRTSSQAPGALRFVVFRRLESGNCRRYSLPDQAIFGPKVHATLVNEFASAVRSASTDGFGGPLVVVIEPDVMPSIRCTLATIPDRAFKKRFLATRISEIKYAIGKFATLPNSTVYVDAGASDYVGWKAQVPYLKAVGINRIRGFSLNVTHYDWTRDNVAYGTKLAKALGVHFVVSTGRAGGGNLPDRLISQGYERGCNIPNAGLGPAPTVKTANSSIDAYLWLLNPGFSDGNCQSGARSFRTPNVKWTQTLALRLIKQRCMDLPRCFGRGKPSFFQ